MKLLRQDRIKQYLAGVDWNLLIFLLLFMNVKLVIKGIALCFIYARRFNLSFGFSFKQSRLPVFYPAMIGIAILNFVLYGLYKNTHYALLLLAGIMLWVLCILAVHQIKLTVEKNNLDRIHRALAIFFVINAVVSCINLTAIMFDAHVINPYIYQGNFQQYFIGTGDFIRGLSFDNSTTNAVLNAFGIMYFLSRKQFAGSLMCMAILLLTCSNLTNIVVMGCLIFLFLFRTNKDQKSIIIIQVLMLVVFMSKISPQNNTYALKISQEIFGRKVPNEKPVVIVPVEARPDSILSADEKKYKYAKLYLDKIGQERTQQPSVTNNKPADLLLVKNSMPKENIHAPDHQHRPDSSATRMQAISLLQQTQQKNTADTINTKVHGKITSFIQLFRFMKEHPSRMITGDGLGNFSSKMAFRASGLQIAGNYPAKYRYVNDDFKNNHMLIYLAFFSTDSIYHSVANSPNSVYAQILGEYGLAGLFFFLFFYLRIFAGSLKKYSYSLPVLLIMCCAFVSEYWFEQLSVVVVFELLMFLDSKPLHREEQKI